jgi:hypothetical protein
MSLTKRRRWESEHKRQRQSGVDRAEAESRRKIKWNQRNSETTFPYIKKVRGKGVSSTLILTLVDRKITLSFPRWRLCSMYQNLYEKFQPSTFSHKKTSVYRWHESPVNHPHKYHESIFRLSWLAVSVIINTDFTWVYVLPRERYTSLNAKASRRI